MPNHGIRSRIAGLGFLVAVVALLGSPRPAAAQCRDYAQPGDPPLADTFDLFPDAIVDVEVVGDVAWVARTTYGALVSLDVSDPANPVTLGVEPVTVMDETYDVDVAGDLGFLTYLQWGGLTGVRVFDISDPADPVDVGDVQAPSGRWAAYLAAAGDHVYASFAYDLFGVVDVSDPTAPVVVGQVAIDHPWEIALQGDRAFVVSNNVRVVTVDISDPTAPALTDTLPTTGPATHLAIQDARAYVSVATGLDVIDVADPDAPQPLAHLPIPDYSGRVSIHGALAYVTGGDGIDNVLHVVDIGDPSAPALHGTIASGDATGRVRQVGQKLLTVSQNQIHLLPAQCALGVSSTAPPAADSGIPVEAFPNPFNPRTVIAFDLPEPEVVTLAVYDLSGRRVATLLDGLEMSAGRQRQLWSGTDDRGRSLAAGVYLCRLQAGARTSSRAVTLLK